jgi:hypothetical protein
VSICRGVNVTKEPSKKARPSGQLFFREGIAFDGNGFLRTAVTAPAFSYLRPIESGNERMVDQNSASWNQLLPWLRRLDILRGAQGLAG